MTGETQKRSELISVFYIDFIVYYQYNIFNQNLCGQKTGFGK